MTTTNLRRVTLGLALTAIVVGVGLLTAALPASATPPGAHTTHVISTPDDTVDGAPWARDTFDRVTTVAKVGDAYLVKMTDTGTFETPGGVKGTLKGEAFWSITGGEKVAAPDAPAEIDRSAVALKDSFTGKWYERFVTGGQVRTFHWKWTYKSTCWKKSKVEVRVESSGAEPKGDRPSKICPPEPSPSTSASVSPSASPSPSTSASASASPSTSASVSPSASPSAIVIEQTSSQLPLTGPSLPVIAVTGALVLTAGGVMLAAARRRRQSFRA